MLFSELYGEELNQELGSADTTALFTLVRRKRAINEAMRWFAVQTECVTKVGSIAVVDGTATYDLEAAFTDLLQIAVKRAAPRLKLDDGTDVEYRTGKQFIRTAVQWLDNYEPGWRGADPGVPGRWYEEEQNAQRLFGLYVPPDIPAGSTWTIEVPYVPYIADMTGDSQEPFEVSSNAVTATRPWHDAIARYAASNLEKYRKGVERSQLLRQSAEARVLDYMDKQRVPGGKRVAFVNPYRSNARTRSAGLGDYGPHDDPWK